MSTASTIPVILSAKRTPIGKFFGGLSKVPSPVLGSYALKAALDAVPGAAAALDEVKDRALEAGMNDFVSKPFHQEELYSRLVQHTSPDVRKNH